MNMRYIFDILYYGTIGHDTIDGWIQLTGFVHHGGKRTFSRGWNRFTGLSDLRVREDLIADRGDDWISTDGFRCKHPLESSFSLHQQETKDLFNRASRLFLHVAMFLKEKSR